MRFFSSDCYPATIYNLIDTCRICLYIYTLGQWHQSLCFYSRTGFLDLFSHRRAS